jgi:hypothetical protein
MELFIHCDGQLKENVELSDLIADAEKLVKANGWFFQVFYDSLPKDEAGKELFKDEVFGFLFSPRDTDPFFICFDTYGKMDCPVRKFREETPEDSVFEFESDEDDDENYNSDAFRFDERYITESIHTTSIKIPTAGMESYKKIRQVLRTLSEKYFSEFRVVDESGYWESGDENELERYFGITNEN